MTEYVKDALLNILVGIPVMFAIMAVAGAFVALVFVTTWFLGDWVVIALNTAIICGGSWLVGKIVRIAYANRR